MEVDLKKYVGRVNQKVASGKTVLEIFSECYEGVLHRPCVSDTVGKDAERWVRAVRAGVGPIVPKYVSFFFEHQDERREYMIAYMMESAIPYRHARRR